MFSRRPGAPLGRALPGVAGIGALLAAALVALPLPSPWPAAAGLGVYALVAALVLDRLPGPRLGAGNAVTLIRAAGTAGIAALATAPAIVVGGLAWGALAATAALIALDGVDGWAARRQGTASAFGARFDMEVDALLILALAALALGTGKAGPWVLGLGLMRYAFVLAGGAWPRLARPLPPSLRRKAICVVQVAVLGLLIAPPVVPPLSQRLAALAFAALAFSFAADVRFLLAARR